jgi:putative transposase
VLGVSRSQLYVRLAGRQQPRSPRYNKVADQALLPLIQQICDQRPSNGYRRVTAHLNRQLASDPVAALQGLSRVNPKRIYRVMKHHQLLLTRNERRCNDRTHDGEIQTSASNQRWCSDGFEIKCWNGEKVRVIFSLDCCDRELISYAASTGGLSGEMVQDVLVSSMEQRFGSITRLARPIEWLSDNGSCYISAQTQQFARKLGFIVCTTPVRSPQSNGMAEAFVKTIKRDYVYLDDLPDAQTVMQKLPYWIADYNRCHPHSSLNMMSPWEFRSLKLAS